jgi:hypothetical protein
LHIDIDKGIPNIIALTVKELKNRILEKDSITQSERTEEENFSNLP